MAIATGTALLIGAGASLIGGIYSSESAKASAGDNIEMQEGILEDQLKFQSEQQKKLDAQKEIYKGIEFKNPYLQMENMYENLENTYEDLTVNQQQAQFQAQQGMQQRASIMQSMRGAAGTSGIAGLAQALANQGQIQAQQISASIGLQESQNQNAAAAAASAIQTAERGGADAVQGAKIAGEQWIQEAEMQRQATLLGMEMGEMAGARAGVQQAQANQMAANAAMTQMLAGQAEGYMNMAGNLMGAGGQMYQGGGGVYGMSANPDYDPSSAGKDVSFGGTTYTTS